MKNLTQILTAFLFFIFLVSCSKEDNTPDSTEALERSAISAKWVVENAAEFESFEFNESGNYIIVKNSTDKASKSTGYETILFGTYEVINEASIYLSDFGTITTSEINNNSIIFSITLTNNPESKIIITANKHKEIGSSTSTNMLCKTWEMVTENGENVASTDMELTIMYSKAGTYFVLFEHLDKEEKGGLAQWKWYNDEETKVLYSWDEEPNWEEEEHIEITELTSTKLKITQHGDIWVLQPASNPTSVALKTSSSLKTGFLNR